MKVTKKLVFPLLAGVIAMSAATSCKKGDQGPAGAPGKDGQSIKGADGVPGESAEVARLRVEWEKKEEAVVSAKNDRTQAEIEATLPIGISKNQSKLIKDMVAELDKLQNDEVLIASKLPDFKQVAKLLLEIKTNASNEYGDDSGGGANAKVAKQAQAVLAEVMKYGGVTVAASTSNIDAVTNVKFTTSASIDKVVLKSSITEGVTKKRHDALKADRKTDMNQGLGLADANVEKAEKEAKEAKEAMDKEKAKTKKNDD